MTDWVRVRDKTTKHEYTTGAVDPEAHEILKKAAVDMYGNPLPPKPHVTPAQNKAASKEETT